MSTMEVTNILTLPYYSSNLITIVTTILFIEGKCMYTQEQEKQLDILKEKIKLLQKERDHIVKSLAISEYVELHTVNKCDFCHAYKNRKTLYDPSGTGKPDLENWKDTFFYTHPLDVAEYEKTTLSPRYLEFLRYSQAHPPFFRTEIKEYYYATVLAAVEAIVATPEGPRFLLADPFGSITTDPAKEISIEVAQEMIGQIVLATIGHRLNSDNHPLKKLRPIGFYKYDT